MSDKDSSQPAPASPYVEGGAKGGAGSGDCALLECLGAAALIVGVLVIIYVCSSGEPAENYRGRYSVGANSSDAGSNRFSSATSQVGAGGEWRTWTGVGPRPKENMMGQPMVVWGVKKDRFLGGPSIKADPAVGHSPENSEAQLRALLQQ